MQSRVPPGVLKALQLVLQRDRRRRETAIYRAIIGSHIELAGRRIERAPKNRRGSRGALRACRRIAITAHQANEVLAREPRGTVTVDLDSRSAKIENVAAFDLVVIPGRGPCERVGIDEGKDEFPARRIGISRPIVHPGPCPLEAKEGHGGSQERTGFRRRQKAARGPKREGRSRWGTHSVTIDKGERSPA